MKRMKRRWESFTSEEVKHIADSTPLEIYSIGGLGNGPYKPPYTDELIGKEYTLQPIL